MGALAHDVPVLPAHFTQAKTSFYARLTFWRQVTCTRILSRARTGFSTAFTIFDMFFVETFVF